MSHYVVKTVPEMGWSGKTNGELLRLASKEFSHFITVDKKLGHQNPLKNYDLAVIILDAISNDHFYLQKLIPDLLENIESFKKGGIYHIPIGSPVFGAHS
ncbi:MAG: hypothetical protein OXN26_15560 [Gammaproteobacteria bacterium]|nr:hypothetical protein [Gammaproteobacteria bacterium]